MQNDHTTLCHLTRLCLNGYEFYCAAADGVDNALLRQYFLKAARIKSEFVNDIEARIGAQTDDRASSPITSSSAGSWLNIVAAAYNDSYHLVDGYALGQLLSRLTRAEEYLCEGFQAALTETESAALRETLLRHLIKFQETQDFLKSLQNLDFAEG
jgi:hypothetical protein